jgi:hypothetical protein
LRLVAAFMLPRQIGLPDLAVDNLRIVASALGVSPLDQSQTTIEKTNHTSLLIMSFLCFLVALITHA